MIRASILCASMLVLAGCSTAADSNAASMAISSRFDAKFAECKRKAFPNYSQKTRCFNDADRILAPAFGGDADLIYYRISKRTEIGERLDKGRITRAQANAELDRITSQILAERNRRVAERMQVAMQVMQAQNTTNTLQSMARSQARIADTLEDASRNRSAGGQRDPFLWARDYARGY